jgi:hypothetical protein
MDFFLNFKDQNFIINYLKAFFTIDRMLSEAPGISSFRMRDFKQEEISIELLEAYIENFYYQ